MMLCGGVVYTKHYIKDKRDKVVVFIIFVSSECEKKDLTTGVPVSRVSDVTWSRATRTFIFHFFTMVTKLFYMTMIQHRPGTAEGDKVLAIVIQVNE